MTGGLIVGGILILGGFGVWLWLVPESGFWSVRAVELLRLFITIAIAALAASIWNERTSKRGKRREVFLSIVSEFAEQLEKVADLANEFHAHPTNVNQLALFRAFFCLDHLRKHVTKRADCLIKKPFVGEFKSDFDELQRCLMWTPFEDSKGISFPKRWRADLDYYHGELRRRCYNYKMEIFD